MNVPFWSAHDPRLRPVLCPGFGRHQGRSDEVALADRRGFSAPAYDLTMTDAESDAFRELCATEYSSVCALLGRWNRTVDSTRVVEEAIRIPSLRGSTLRLLLLDSVLNSGASTACAVFPSLVELASCQHSDILLDRAVIKCMPRRWVVQHIE